MSTPSSSPPLDLPDDVLRAPDGAAAVVIARTSRGWSVLSALGDEAVDDLVEALSLADLVAEGIEGLPERSSARRKPTREPLGVQPGGDQLAEELVALRRAVGQLEHALATRVTIERAIGVLAERQGLSPRAAFEGLRREARASGRLVHDLARAVLATLHQEAPVAPVPTEAAVAPLGNGRRRVERAAGVHRREAHPAAAPVTTVDETGRLGTLRLARTEHRPEHRPEHQPELATGGDGRT